MAEYKTYEYIWLDGYKPEPSLRSKVKVTEGEAPEWSFDGSSTKQAEGGSSDCLLLPVQMYDNPTTDGALVMCQVQTGDHETHPSNERAAAGIPEGLVRYSTGIEDVEDLINDLDQALSYLI